MLDIVQLTVENIGNTVRKNNICICGLKEQAGGQSFISSMEELLAEFFGSDLEATVSILLVYRVGLLGKLQKPPRDIILKFSNWETKKPSAETSRKRWLSDYW